MCLKRTLLRLEHVCWSAPGTGRSPAVLLDDVSLEVGAGDLAGLHGPRPAELTALATIAAGRAAPHAGAVLLDGRPLGDLSRGGGADAAIGFASRVGPALDDLDVVTWIASGLLDAASWRTARRRAWTAIDRVGLGTAATLRWPRLSTAERALAALAQAIVRGPRVLVVDGLITGAADGDRGEDAILDLLRACAAEGVAVLATASDADHLPGCAPLFALGDGRLAGPPPTPVGQVIPLRARRD